MIPRRVDFRLAVQTCARSMRARGWCHRLLDEVQCLSRRGINYLLRTKHRLNGGLDLFGVKIAMAINGIENKVSVFSERYRHVESTSRNQFLGKHFSALARPPILFVCPYHDSAFYVHA